MYLGIYPGLEISSTTLSVPTAASQVPFTPVGNIASTNVQTALAELDTEKQATITGAASSISVNDLTAQKVLVSDINGKVGTSSVNSSELSFLSGLSGGTIQVQLDSKLDKAGGTMAGPITLSGDGTAALHAVTKQQLDGKLNISGGTVNGSVFLNTVPGLERQIGWTFSEGNVYLFGNDTNNSVGLYDAFANVLRWSTDSAGNFVAAGNVTGTSDARLKKDLEIVVDAVDKVKALTGYTYTRIDTGERNIGLIAQDVQRVVPEAVVEGEYLSVAYGNLVGLLVEAIKDQQKQIDELRAKIDR